MVYKRAVIMIRTLIGVVANASDARCAFASDASTRHARWENVLGRDARVRAPRRGRGDGFGERASGQGVGISAFAFADVPTSIGKLRACVYF